MWDAAHALLTISPRTRANRTRRQTPSLLRGLIFGEDDRRCADADCPGTAGGLLVSNAAPPADLHGHLTRAGVMVRLASG
jgi:hypothetical protein